MTPSEPPPSLIGRYTITGEIGSGGFARVYGATDPTFGRTVAIKVMKAPDDPAIVRRFRSEARMVANLQHRSIVTVYDFGDEAGAPYLVMEYLNGDTLQRLIAANSFTLLEKLEILAEVAEGLRYAHDRSVTHRDVKPANIMRLADGSVKIMDFGIARIAADSTQTATGSLIGTLRYMAPEQFKGTADPVSDIFAFGVTAYELLSGQNPFAAPDPAMTLYQITSTDAPPLRSVMADVPEALDAILRRALAREREARYTSLADLLLDLRPILGDLRRQHAANLYAEAGQLLVIGDLQAAESSVRKVFDLDPTYPGAPALRTEIGQAIQRRDALARATSVLEKAEGELAQGRPEEAASLLSAAPPLAWMALALQTRFDQAAARIERMLASQQLLESARADLLQENLTEAFRATSEVLAQDPESAAAHGLLQEIRSRIAEREARRRLRTDLARCEELLMAGETGPVQELLAQLEAGHPGSSEVASLRTRLDEQRARAELARRLAKLKSDATVFLDHQEFAAAIRILQSGIADFGNDEDLSRLWRAATDGKAAQHRIRPEPPVPPALPTRRVSPMVWIAAIVVAAAGLLFWLSRPGGGTPLSIEPPAILDKTVAGIAFSLQLRASGGEAPVVWSIASGSTPPGLTLDPARGVIAGTPSAAGQFAFRAMATDTAGHIAVRDLTIPVEPAASLPPSCQSPRFVLSQYGDATSGELIWTGSLPAGGRLTIQNRRASTGRVRGDLLPEGVPIRLSQSPASVSLISAPSAANCWVSELELQGGATAASEIRIRWQVYQP